MFDGEPPEEILIRGRPELDPGGRRFRMRELRLRARSFPELTALAVLLLVYLTSLVFGWGPGNAKSVEIAFLAPFDALVVWASWRASRRVSEPWLRSFWTLMAVAWTVELFADLALALYDIVLADPTFPSAADAFFLLFYAIAFRALLEVPAVRGSGSQRLRVALDTATIAVGGAVAVWYFVLGPTITGGGQGLLETSVSVAYPLADVALIGMLGMLLMRRGPGVVRVPLRLVGLGLGLMVVADTLYGYLQLHGSYAPGDAVDVLLVPAFVLAATSQRGGEADEATPCAEGRGEPSLRATGLPMLAMLLGFGLLLATQWRDRFFPDLSLLLFALALAGLVALRQHVAQKELLQLQGRVRTIVENVAEGIVTFDEGWNFRSRPRQPGDPGARRGLECGHEPRREPEREVLIALGLDPSLPDPEPVIRTRLGERRERRLAELIDRDG